MDSSPSQTPCAWYLEEYVDGRRSTRRRSPIQGTRFRIGRRADLELVLAFPTVSALHAEIEWLEGELRMRDAGSRNGTFVNRRRLDGVVALREGDVIHLGDHELRVGCERLEDGQLATMELEVASQDLPRRMVTGLREFAEMVEARAVAPLYQPIVELDGGAAIAHEVLGRGADERLEASPLALFRIAADVGREAELSRLFRDVGVEAAAGSGAHLFVNTHPVELRERGLVRSLGALRERVPDVALTLEVHEAAVAGPAPMRELRARLADLSIGLAYDDFGAGQARWLELVDVPPDVLKFDIAWIRDVDKAPATRRQALGTLVTMARDLGVRCLAEGVERQAEADVCRALGFELAQGYFFGRPAALEE